MCLWNAIMLYIFSEIYSDYEGNLIKWSASVTLVILSTWNKRKEVPQGMVSYFGCQAHTADSRSICCLVIYF